MRVFDTHCHLGGHELRPQASEIAARAASAGVAGLALICADVSDLPVLRPLAEKLRLENPVMQIIHTAGIHPHEGDGLVAGAEGEAVWTQIEELSRTASAIGETGLDYFYDHADRDNQKAAFDRHIEMACTQKKPLVIHCRQAAADILSMLDRPSVKNHGNPGILHCFAEDLNVAKILVERGFYISFSGILTFRNADPLREVAKALPLDRILIETDSPWLAPMPMRGKRNEPAFVAHLFEHFCTLRSESREEIQATLWRNSCNVFGLEA